MKKIGVLLAVLFAFSLFSLIVAQEDAPSTLGGAEGDMESIQGAIDEIPIDESGKIDKEKISGFKSKAEERIDAINQWLEEKAPWLKIVFGMVPEISWLFAINFYFMLLFLVIFVLNNNVFSFFVSDKLGKIAGLGVYLILLITKVYFNLAKVIHNLFVFVWTWGWIAVIILGIVFVVLLIYAPHVLLVIKKWIDEWKEAKAKAETDVNRKALGKIVKGAVGED